MPFEKNVFINCPFDDDYVKLLRPLLFTVIYLEFEPKISQTVSSANIRINQIKKNIQESKFGIHDLSRCRPLKQNELPRFNMPYELGLDIGCSEYGNKRHKQKKILILETEKYHYQKVISDIAGQDIKNHNDDPNVIIKEVRNWFSIASGKNKFPPANKIWLAYNQFAANLNETLISQGYTEDEINKMQHADFISFAKDWITAF